LEFQREQNLNGHGMIQNSGIQPMTKDNLKYNQSSFAVSTLRVPPIFFGLTETLGAVPTKGCG
jgi:hypothetical protein